MFIRVLSSACVQEKERIVYHSRRREGNLVSFDRSPMVNYCEREDLLKLLQFVSLSHLLTAVLTHHTYKQKPKPVSRPIPQSQTLPSGNSSFVPRAPAGLSAATSTLPRTAPSAPKASNSIRTAPAAPVGRAAPPPPARAPLPPPPPPEPAVEQYKV